MKKLVAALLALLFTAALPPIQAATLDQKIASDVLAATRLKALPKVLEKSLLQARKDKSPWLDQICSVDFASTDTPVCEGGSLASKRLVILYGDSHASMWMSALDSIGKRNNFKVRLFAKLACPIVEVPIWSYQLNKPFNECTEWQSKVLATIQDLKPDAIITTDQWKPAVVDGKKSDFDTPFMWEKEFPIALAHLNNMTKKLIVIGNNPSLSEDPVSCASKPKVNIVLCASGRTQADNARYNKTEQSATKSLGGTYIDTVAWACTPLLCPIVIANKLAYFDQWHFSESYVKYLSPSLEQKVLLALPRA